MVNTSSTDIPARVTLRQLPLSARWVLSVFLIAVGLGYVSAMVQLHMQHSSKEGEVLPTIADVVEVFAGLKKIDPNAPAVGPPESKLERLVTGPVEGAAWNGSGSMAAAFFHKDGANYRKESPTHPGMKAEREGEQSAVREWIRLTDSASRSDAYRTDRMPIPDSLRGHPLTTEYQTDDKSAVKIRTLITDRCARCHAKGAEQEKYPLETYEQLLGYMAIPKDRPAPPAGYTWSDRQVGIEKLTQSTHAHLLSFAMLFTLTGLTFAFTSYPGIVRGIVSPVVLVAQVADVTCWWLARMPDYGHYFAEAIVFTGGIVGVGLMLQIVFGLLNMYGLKGKVVVVLLFLLGGAVASYIGTAVVKPELDAERAATAQRKPPADAPKVDPPIEKPKDNAPNEAPKANKPAESPKTPGSPPPQPRVALLEKLIMGPRTTSETVKFDGKGTMAPAFFEKDSGFRKEIKARPAAEVEAEREGERAALVAWIRLAPAARKQAFDADALPLPSGLKGKPVTPDYLTDDKASIKVQLLLTDRCAKCHCEGGEQEKYPLETYDQIAKYLDGTATAAAHPTAIPPARD